MTLPYPYPATTQTIRLLLVEDEPDVASVIKRALEESGYDVTVAPDGPSALGCLDSFSYDVYLFDIMIPGGSGLELCRRCRHARPDSAILLLTALGSTDNVVMGLDSGADDYLTKPFQLAELHARIRSLLRRRPRHDAAPAAASPGTLAFGGIVLDLNEKIVRGSRRASALTATEYRLLEYFLRNPRRVCSRIDILEQVWGYDMQLNTKVVDVYVNYLRRKLEKVHDVRLIQTVVGMGYILKEERDADSN
ncbi:response regulator transcription factor [Flaviaesturariibacter amylovorans]|uniref:Response regulator transcription factor n=1 Tax=Flaviaesturariibacter amylovorans TaxID=1084520 RepID=A0ABP8HSG8_9BACT